MKYLAITCFLGLACASAAQAQSERPSTDQSAAVQILPAAEEGGPHNFVAAGLAIGPKYPGSKTYAPVPLVVADIDIKGIDVSTHGPELRADVLGGRSHFLIGPAIGYDFGRKPSDGGVARKLNKIGGSLRVGEIVGYRFGGNETGQGQVELTATVLQDVSKVDKGATATAAVSYVIYRNTRWNVAADVSGVYATGKSMRTYFGVTPQESLTSGLAAYSPGSGIESVGGGLNIGYQLSRRWGVFTRIGYDDLVGKAGKSPIVKAGSHNQFLGGVGLSFRF